MATDLHQVYTLSLSSEATILAISLLAVIHIPYKTTPCEARILVDSLISSELCEQFQLKFAINKYILGCSRFGSNCAHWCSSTCPKSNGCSTICSMPTPKSVIHQRLQLHITSTYPLLSLVLQNLFHQLWQISHCN